MYVFRRVDFAAAPGQESLLLLQCYERGAAYVVLP
jgi:hypothetical protein